MNDHEKSQRNPPGAPVPAAESPFYASAVALHLEGKAKEALAELERALQGKAGLSDAQGAEIYSGVGYLHMEAEQFEKAVDAYTKLLDITPEHVSGAYNLAICLEAIGRWDLAAKRLEQVLSLEPGHPDAQLDLGACYLHLGDAQ